METEVSVKIIDAVKMMRDVRDKISEETQSMSLEELKKYIAEKTKNSRLRAFGR